MLKEIVIMTALIGIMALSPSILYAQDMDKHLQEARQIIEEFGGELRTNLQKQMGIGGPVAAISVCSKIAPSISSKLSRQSGESVRRVSLKIRNPLSIPDQWEQEVLQRFEQEHASGKAVSGMEHSEIVTQGDRRYFRYMKAVPTGDICLVCHGPRDDLHPDIRKLLDKKYPHDKATGFKKGMIRGAFSVKRPL
jgi:hypothetical protein